MYNLNQKTNMNNHSQNFMTNVQQNNMKLHELCNNFDYGLLTIKDFANKMGIPKSTVYSWRKTETMPKKCFKKIGGSIFVRDNEAKNWLAE